MKGFWLALASVISALAATLCCLPALLFLIFGASFSLLSSEAIESLTELCGERVLFFQKAKNLRYRKSPQKMDLHLRFFSYFCDYSAIISRSFRKNL